MTGFHIKSEMTIFVTMSRTRIIYSVLFCIYIAAVAFLCFAKPDDLPQMPQLWFGLPADKVGHFLMFMPFPVLAFLTFETEGMAVGRQLLLLTVLLTVGAGLAIGTEHVQAQLAYRAAETKDFYADAAGLAIGGLCTLAFFILRRSR